MLSSMDRLDSALEDFLKEVRASQGLPPLVKERMEECKSWMKKMEEENKHGMGYYSDAGDALFTMAGVHDLTLPTASDQRIQPVPTVSTVRIAIYSLLGLLDSERGNVNCKVEECFRIMDPWLSDEFHSDPSFSLSSDAKECVSPLSSSSFGDRVVGVEVETLPKKGEELMGAAFLDSAFMKREETPDSPSAEAVLHWSASERKGKRSLVFCLVKGESMKPLSAFEPNSKGSVYFHPPNTLYVTQKESLLPIAGVRYEAWI